MKRNKKKVLVFWLAAVILTGLFTGCGKDKKVTYDKDVKTHIFTDSYGRKVEVPEKITRIVPSGPTADMILYTIAPKLMVGVSSAPSTVQMPYMKEDYQELPTLGQFYGRKTSLNLETLLKTKAEVIIDLGERQETGREDLDDIQSKTGIATVFIEATMDNYGEAYRMLGSLLGKEEAAKQLADYCDETIQVAADNAAKIKDEERVSVMFGTSSTGLNCNAKGSVHAAVIEQVGAKNAVEVESVSNRDGGNPINMEQLYVLNPQVIILSPGGPFDKLKEDAQWSGLKAVKDDKYYEIPYLPYNWMASPPSINQVLGVRWLGNLLYPDLYSYDMVEEARKFYQLFWHYELTKEEAQEFLSKSTLKEGVHK